MGRLNYFLAGTFVGSLQILNQVYENELIHQQIQHDMQTTQRIQHFVSLHILNIIDRGIGLGIQKTQRNTCS